MRERFARIGVGQLRAWVATGGTVLFGTYVGYMADYDPRDEYPVPVHDGLPDAGRRVESK